MGTVASQIGRNLVLAGGRLEPDVRVQFSPVEILQGATGPDSTITVHTGQGGGDCGYPFVTGSQYLVYASVLQGRLTTSICTSTVPA